MMELQAEQHLLSFHRFQPPHFGTVNGADKNVPAAGF
jgi:hypothetical protein